MPYGWNPIKAAANLAKHGVAFQAAEGFEWDTAVVRADTRASYGEVRLVALGVIGERLHSLAFTIRRTVWIISLRKASAREVGLYEREAG